MTPARYLRNLVVLLDIAFNVIVLLSHEVESLSRRAGRAMLKGKRWGCVLCRALDVLDRGHCLKSLRDPPV